MTLKNEYEKKNFIKEIKLKGFVIMSKYSERGRSWVNYDKKRMKGDDNLLRWQIRDNKSYLDKGKRGSEGYEVEYIDVAKMKQK